MTESDEPEVEGYYEISVKVPEDIAHSHRRVQHYLDELAETINESDLVRIQHEDGVGIRRDATGAAWQDATLSIQYNIGCGPKRGGWGDDDGDGEDDDGGGDSDDVPG